MIRLDDLTDGGRSWSFDDPTASGQALDLAHVVEVVCAAERRAVHHGEWVVLVLAYEAAAAFDPVMRTAATPPPGTPYVWWQSFDERSVAPALPPIESRVVSRERTPNLLPHADAVATVRSRIDAGDVYQVNVTDRFAGEYVGTPLEMYSALLGVQRCAFGAYIDMGERAVASVSPELFFRWDDSTIECRPMKGTTERRPRLDDDERAAAILRASTKEQAENVMIVDLLRNDLGRVARIGSVRVPDLFTVERYETVWQLTSTVRAEVDDDTELVDVLTALFPCGSITGAPKIAAMNIITELEADARGVYCGAIGLLSPRGEGPRAVFSVPIRTAVLDPAAATYVYGAGGGITWSSDAEAEDAEVRAKARILTRSHRELSLLETLRNDADGMANVEAHLDRMEASARWFGYPFHRSEIAERLTAIEPSDDVERIRLLVDETGVIVVERHALDPSPAPVMLALDGVVTRSDDPYCCHKTTWRRHYGEARRRHPDADDVVLVNEHGHAIETTIANLAYRIADRWYVPPLADGGLAGVARQIALDDGRLTERSILAIELHHCDELAVINDLRGWRQAKLLGVR